MDLLTKSTTSQEGADHSLGQPKLAIYVFWHYRVTYVQCDTSLSNIPVLIMVFVISVHSFCIAERAVIGEGFALKPC